MACERYELVIAPSAQRDYENLLTDRLKNAVRLLCLDPEDDPKKGRFPYEPRTKLNPLAVGDPMEPGHLLIVIEGRYAARIGYRIDRQQCLVTIAAAKSAPYLM